jgi:hypothetical protein
MNTNNTVERVIPAKFNRIQNVNIRKHIREYHKTQIGGVKSGGGETEYSVSMKNVKKFLQRARRFGGNEGWVAIDQILEYCETHYSNPKPSLIATLQAKWNESWCESKVENRRRYFRYKN